MMAAESPITGVLLELCEAFEDEPFNFHLLGVMADCAEENGYPTTADCLRWCMEKRKTPYLKEVGRGWALWNRHVLPSDRLFGKYRNVTLPEHLEGPFDSANGFSRWTAHAYQSRSPFCTMLNRLTNAWLEVSVDRKRLWAWNPEAG